MRFGRTILEQNRRRNQRFEIRKERLTKWHYWFAWWPVETHDGRYVWLEGVARRMCSVTGSRTVFVNCIYIRWSEFVRNELLGLHNQPNTGTGQSELVIPASQRHDPSQT